MIELFFYAFFGFLLLLGLGAMAHAYSIDPPLENEDYLAENPELRKLKMEQMDAENSEDKPEE